MSEENNEENLNEVIKIEEKNIELITDKSSSKLERKNEKNKGPKRISKNKYNDNKEIESLNREEILEEVVNEIEEEEKSIIKVSKELIIEELKPVISMKLRYFKMITGKRFEVRYKGNLIYYNSKNLSNYELNDNGITINDKFYKYSEVVIRIKK